MSQLITIDTVQESVSMYTGKTPDHPLIHVVDLADTEIAPALLNARICSNLYSLVFKANVTKKVQYGRRHYDFSSGVITAFAPGQVIEINELYKSGELKGWSLIFHPDALLQHPLKEAIKQYGYFSYDICEALHASEREQQTLNRLASEIKHETQQNQDELSLEILLSNIDLLLKYTNRYFSRQFLTRKPFTQNSVERFNRLVDEHIDKAMNSEIGLPKVHQLAEEMNMSANYMSDMLRKQTGKNAQDLIHQQLIERAKYRLLNSDDSVSSIAYQLGFEYPQYFSRMFKKKTSMTPQEYRTMQ